MILGLCLLKDIAFVVLFESIYPEKSNIEFIAEVMYLKEEKEYKNKYIVKLIEMQNIASNTKYEKFKNTKLILYTERNLQLFPGDIICVDGHFEKGEKARNYKGYNYRNYLKKEKIYGIVNSEKIKKISSKKDIYYILGKINETLYGKLDELYEEKYSEFLKGILFGNAKNIDNQIKENFRTSSISHILAISGMHISYIIIGTEYLLGKITINKKLRNYILIIVLLFFLILTGGTVSCIRGCIMTTINIISFNFYRKNNIVFSMFFSFIIILLINPFYIFDIGMWLSFLATLGIIKFYKIFIKLFEKKLKIKRNIISEYMCISVSAQILIFPIIIYSFNTFSLTFFIFNILVSFFIGYVIGIGYISIFISYLLPNITNFLINIESELIYILFKISELGNLIPFSKIYLTTPKFVTIIFYYCFIFYLIKIFNKNKFYCIKILLSKKYLRKFLYEKYINLRKIFLKIFLRIKSLNNVKIIILINICVIISFIIINFNKDLKIYFIDVSQGDSCLIVTPENKKILIDGGEGNSEKYDQGKNVVFPYLLDRKINKLDYVIISHFDNDHVGGLIYVIENIKVNRILLGIQTEENFQLNKILELAKEKSIEIITLNTGERINIEKDTYIDILWPDKENIIDENKLNNNSLVFKFIYKDFSILFTGDIESIAEKEILEKYKNDLESLKANILKVAHHGSKTSSNLEFLETIKPQIALIGVGKNNNFGHPSINVLERFENMNIKIYRTDLNGEIEIKLGIFGLKIHTKLK